MNRLLPLAAALFLPPQPIPLRADSPKAPTLYLENADAHIGIVTTVIPKIETPRASPQASPTPSPTPSPDDEFENSLIEHPLQSHSTTPIQKGPTRLFVGSEIPVPTAYTSASITVGPAGIPLTAPSSPTDFETRKTGTLMETGGCETVLHSTELQGFIDYGSPIHTAIPAYDADGRPIGIQILTTPNPILQPVFQTIELR